MARFNQTLFAVIIALLAGAVACSKSSTREAASSADATSGDLLILRSGQTEKGQLKTCVAERCQLDENSIPRDQIVWIGLSTAIPPPALKDPAHDEVHARDGSVESARLVSISLGNVVTEQRSYDRTQVAWVHLAPPPGGAASQPGPPADGATSQPGTTFFHYDVVVTGHAQSAETSTSTSHLNGTTTTTLDWTTTFKDVVLKKAPPTAKVMFIGRARPGPIKGGTTDVKYTFEYTMDEDVLYSGRRCHGAIQLSTLGSVLQLTGSQLNGPTEFLFHTGLDSPAGNQLNHTILKQADDACNKQRFQVYLHRDRPKRILAVAWPMWPEEHDGNVAVVRGLTIRRFIGLLEVEAERKAPEEGPLVWPLKELAAGDAFSFTTGEVQRSFSCGAHCNATAMTELKADVTPHR